MVTVKKVRLVNPHKPSNVGQTRTAPRPAKKAKRKNPGALYLLGKTAAALNPQKGGHTKMAKTAKKKNPAAHKNPKVRAAIVVKKSNPGRPKARRRNPDITGALTQPIELLKFGLIALFGLVATRQVPQMALGTKNESWTGYLANLGTAIAGAYGTTRFAGKTAGIAFGTGGGLYTVNRILTDKFTPVGKVLSLSGLGDAQASHSLGRIIPGSVYPPSYDSAGNLQLPPAFVAAARAQLTPAPVAAAGMSGGRLSGRGSRLAA